MKCSTTQIRKRITFAAAVAAVAAVPGFAQAQSTAPCPTGTPLQNTVNSACEAAAGVENSVRNGGIVPAAQELQERESQTVSNLRNQQEQAVEDKLTTTTGNVGATRTAAENGVSDINTGKDGLSTHVIDSETALEQSFVPNEDDRTFNCPAPHTDRPLVDHVGNEACNAAGGFATLVSVPTQQQLNSWLGDLIGLGGFGNSVTGAVDSISGSLWTLVDAEPDSLLGLAEAILGNTDNGGAQTVNNVSDAVQCVRKGDYGSGARETPCPR